MEWMILAVSAAFFNALWTSLTTKKDKELSSMQFTIIFRFLTLVILLPLALFSVKIGYFNIKIIGLAVLYALLEGIRTIFIVKGAQEDYYATYAFVNMSPIFTVMLSFLVPGESINIFIIAGTLSTIVGGFIFYSIGKFSTRGLIVAAMSGLGVIVSKLGVSESNGIGFSFFSFFFLVLIFSVADIIKTKRVILFEVNKYFRTTALPAVFSAAATLSYFTSLETGQANKVANIMRVNLLFGFLFSYFLLKEIENWKMKFAGGALILLGGFIVYFG